jgi:cytoskeletal protein RodZ
MFEIGSSLRDARLRQGLELTGLEAETKIRAKYLKALEEEQFDLLPGDSYAKGFLRVYAERLGLDGQLYVDEYNSRFALADEPVIAARSRRKQRSTRVERNAVLIALAGIVAVTVLVIAAWRFGTGSGDGGEPAGETSPVASQPATTAEAAPATTGAPTTEAVASISLKLTATQRSSYVEAREGSASGEIVWQGTLKKGRSQLLRGEELWVRVTRPRGLTFAIDGKAVPPAGARGSSLLVFSAEGVRLVGTS